MEPLYDPETLEEWDDEYLWHPFTPHSVYRDEDPLTVVGGDGHYLIDAEGRRYLDGVSSIWCNPFGHRREEIDEAIRDQLDRIAHSTLLGHANDRAVELAKRLVEVAPEDSSKAFFSDDGSTAMEIALKMAIQYWQQAEGGRESQRTTFLSFSNQYNGDTVGAVSTGGIDLFHSRFEPLLFDVIRALSPRFYERPEGQSREVAVQRFVDAFDDLVEEYADQLAAVVMEPGMQGAGGMVKFPEGFLGHAREVTERHGILLIVDEVAMGMGRTGSMFYCQQEDVQPDLMAVAKMLTGGYTPLAATLTTDEIYEAFLGPPEEGRTFFHGHTYTGNAIGAAAAVATLDIFEEENVLEEMQSTIDHLAEGLESLSSNPWVGDIRQLGLAAGVELTPTPGERESFESADRVGQKVCRAAREKGVFLRPLEDVIVLMPPLSISRDEIDDLLEAVEYGIDEVAPEYGESSSGRVVE
ncbi:MAG: adenosylmethionine--8-amino-7-oxononanoate transaminase [Bradymonadaceae bacterium]